MSQFCGCGPTAYEAIAFVLYSTSCSGVVVAGVVTGALGTVVVVLGTVVVVGAVLVRAVVWALVGGAVAFLGLAVGVRELASAAGWAALGACAGPAAGWAAPQPAKTAPSKVTAATHEANDANHLDGFDGPRTPMEADRGQGVERRTAPRA
jgi:hypothetical protein